MKGRVDLVWLLVTYQDGLPVDRRSVTYPSSNHLIATWPAVKQMTFWSQSNAVVVTLPSTVFCWLKR